MVLKLTPDKVPNIADTPAPFRQPFDDFGASYQYSTLGLFYNGDTLKNPPKSWPEFFERAGNGEFGKSLTLPDISYTWTPHIIWHYAAALGGSIDNLDPAFNALRKVKPYVVKFWGSALEVDRMVASRDVEMGVLWDGRSYGLAKAAPSVRYTRLAPHTLLGVLPSQVVKGGNEALGLQWVNTLLDPAPQLQYAMHTNFAVTNSKVKLPPDMQARMMPLSQGVTPPYRELMRAIPRIIERWNREMRG
jgi:putative spermidine/putrescine transport system substrate-binding protein